MVKIRSTGNPYEADRPKPRHRAGFDEVVVNLTELLQLDNSGALIEYLRSVICDALKGTKFKSETDCVYNYTMVGGAGLNVQLTIVDPDSSVDRSEEHFVLHFTGGTSRTLPDNLKGQVRVADLSKVQMVTRKSLTLTLVSGVSEKDKKAFKNIIGRKFVVEIDN